MFLLMSHLDSPSLILQAVGTALPRGTDQYGDHHRRHRAAIAPCMPGSVLNDNVTRLQMANLAVIEFEPQLARNYDVVVD